jgi:hypothetical protein
MPEWRKIIRERLGALDISPEREEEIVVELADYFEDAYDDHLERSAAPEQALASALSEVKNWARLSRDIFRAHEEDPMNERTKNLWLPGMVTLFLSSVLLMFITRRGPVPVFVWIDPRIPLLLYVPWLVSLPVFGAAGAYWSRRMGGAKRARIAAGVFPALMLAAAFCVILPVSILIQSLSWRTMQWKTFGSPFLSAIVIFTLGWVVIPGVALLLGALPFLRNGANQSAPSRA